jgi:hypothetical protein
MSSTHQHINASINSSTHALSSTHQHINTVINSTHQRKHQLINAMSSTQSSTHQHNVINTSTHQLIHQHNVIWQESGWGTDLMSEYAKKTPENRHKKAKKWEKYRHARTKFSVWIPLPKLWRWERGGVCGGSTLNQYTHIYGACVCERGGWWWYLISGTQKRSFCFLSFPQNLQNDAQLHNALRVED